MANSNFVVQNGLTVGPLTIDAATGSITTSGDVNITGNLGVSQISKNDSSVSINDTGTGSTVVIKIDGATEQTVDANGVNLATGGFYSINGSSVLNASTLGTGVTASSLTSVGTLTGLTVSGTTALAGTTAGTLNATVGNIGTLAVTTGLSTANAVITGGSLNNTTVGATTHNTGRFTTVTATTVNAGTIGNSGATLTGTLSTAAQTNITSVGTLTGLTSSGIVNITNNTQSDNNSTGALVVTGGAAVGANLHVGGSLHITGNLEVNGTQTIFNTNVSVIEDSMIYLGNNNTGDVLDIGFVSAFTGPGYQHTGLVRDASDSTWKLFANVVAEPTTVVDFTFATYSPLRMGALTASSAAISGNTAITSTIYAQGIYDNGNRVVSTSAGAGNLTIVGTEVDLTLTGPGAATVGSSTAIPVITTDAYGRVASTSTAAVVAPAGTLSGATLNSTVTASSLTSVGALTGLTVSGLSTFNSNITLPSAAGTVEIKAGTGDNATYSTYNTTIRSWWGIGFRDYTDSNIAKLVIDCRTGNVSSVGSMIAGTVVAGTINAGTIGNTGATLTGTLSTAAQTNVTSVGTLTGLSMSGLITGRTGAGGVAAVSNDAGSLSVRGDATNAAVISFHRPSLYAINMGLDTDNVFKIGGWSATANCFQLTGAGALTLTSGITTTGNIVPSANVTYNLGSTTAWWNTLYGVATQAKYADLAENYQADKAYKPGTVLMFGGAYEVTLADVGTTAVAGVVSTNPAHLMNGQLSGTNVVALALTGRVPCMVIGPIKKGDLMVSAGFGYARTGPNPSIGQVIGKALEDYPEATKGVIEVVVGRT